MPHTLATEKLAALLKYLFDETECFIFIVKPNITQKKRYYTKLLWPLRQYVEHYRQIQSLIELH